MSQIDPKVINLKTLQEAVNNTVDNINKIDELNSKIEQLPGSKIPEGGEIFNNYAENEARGDYSHAEGNETIAAGKASHTEGNFTSTMLAANYCKIKNINNKEANSDIESTYTHFGTIEFNDKDKEVYNKIFELRKNIGDIEAYFGTGPKDDNLPSEITYYCSIPLTDPASDKYTNPTDVVSNANNVTSLKLKLSGADNQDYDDLKNKIDSYNVYFWLPRDTSIGQGTNITNVYSNDNHAEGSSTVAHGNSSHAEGLSTIAYGSNSHAEGSSSKANGINAHAEGGSTIAIGNNSHAEGRSSIVEGYSSHAEGYGTNAKGNQAHAEGHNTVAQGNGSHAEGYGTKAQGTYSHAEGQNTEAKGANSHAGGHYTTASGENSYAGGHYTTASGLNSHAEGYKTKADKETQFVIGKYNATSSATFIVGNGTTENNRKNAFEVHSDGHAEVQLMGTSNKSVATREYVNRPQCMNVTSGYGGDNAPQMENSSYNIVFGGSSGNNTLKTAYSNVVAGTKNSIDPGEGTSSSSHLLVGASNHIGYGYYNIVGGNNNSLSSDGPKNPITCNIVSGTNNEMHNGSCNNILSGENNEIREYNRNNIVSGTGNSILDDRGAVKNSFIIGNENIITNSEGSAIIGYGNYLDGYNYEDKKAESAWGRLLIGAYGEVSAFDPSGKAYRFAIGNGIKKDGNITTALCFAIDSKGNAYGTKYNTGGADYAEMFEWSDGNPDKEDRRGYFVTLEDDKIKFASSGDYVLGIVSSTPSVVGDSYDLNWHGKYLTDIFGKPLTEKVFIEEERDGEGNIIMEAHYETREILNPEYDKDKKYLSRDSRPEWGTVGMMGKLIVIDDGTCEVNGYCNVSENGVGTKATTGWRVTKRLDDTHIQVIFK